MNHYQSEGTNQGAILRQTRGAVNNSVNSVNNFCFHSWGEGPIVVGVNHGMTELSIASLALARSLSLDSHSTGDAIEGLIDSMNRVWKWVQFRRSKKLKLWGHIAVLECFPGDQMAPVRLAQAIWALKMRINNGYMIFLRDHARQVPPSDRRKILSEGKCRNCGSVERLQVDHIIPVSRGGGRELENLQPLCRPCNMRKGARYKTPKTPPNPTPYTYPEHVISSYNVTKTPKDL